MKSSFLIDKLVYGIGLTSLFFLPYFYGIRIADILLFILVYILMLNALLRPPKIKYASMLILFISLIYFLITMMGAVLNTPDSLKSIMVSLRYMAILIAVFFLYLNRSNSFELFIKGFRDSAIINVLWMIMDNFYYYILGNFDSINEVIFEKYAIGVEHSLTNRGNYLGDNEGLLLRSAGLGWDPGGIGPALIIAYIILDRKNNKLKYFILMGVFLCMSRTSILILFLYLMYRYLARKNIQVAHVFIVMIAIIFILSSFFLSPSNSAFDEGTIRHIKYFSGLAQLTYAKFSEILFGFGYRGTGVFFLKYVEWLKYHDFSLGDDSVVESTLVNLFLYGGIFGIFYNALLYLFLIKVPNRIYSDLVIFLLILYIGYTFENLWTVFLTYAMLFETINKYIHAKIEKQNIVLDGLM
ncbi:MAG TPA: hypothetical protein VF941_23660 [Clostridia bacterium]